MLRGQHAQQSRGLGSSSIFSFDELETGTGLGKGLAAMVQDGPQHLADLLPNLQSSHKLDRHIAGQMANPCLISRTIS